MATVCVAMHWRPADYWALPMAEINAIIDALNEKYDT